MTVKTTVTFVDAWEVMQYMGYTDDEIAYILDNGFVHVSFGDASFTLIDNRVALEYILDGNMSLDTPMDEDGARSRYWEVVNTYDYINLEAA